jgi:hypothetical protein
MTGHDTYSNMALVRGGDVAAFIICGRAVYLHPNEKHKKVMDTSHLASTNGGYREFSQKAGVHWR